MVRQMPFGVSIMVHSCYREHGSTAGFVGDFVDAIYFFILTIPWSVMIVMLCN
jgi:hypothetical protein